MDLGQLGANLGHLEASLGQSSGHIAAILQPLKAIKHYKIQCFMHLSQNLRSCAILVIVGHLRAILGPPWGHLGPIWKPSGGHLGAILGHLGPSWGHLGAIMGSSWAFLGPSAAIWGHLGAIWAHLGPSWRHLGPSWGQFGAILVPSCSYLAALGGHKTM